MEVSIDDLEKALSGKVLFMAIAEVGSEQHNYQSCDCDEVIIVMRDRILLAKHEPFVDKGTIGFEAVPAFDEGKYNLRVYPPADGSFEFKKVLYYEDGSIDCIKYRFGDRYVLIFSSCCNLIVTKSIIDLSGDEDAPIPAWDPSVLFESGMDIPEHVEKGEQKC